MFRQDGWDAAGLASGVSVHALRATEHLAGHAHRVQELRGATAARDFSPVPRGLIIGRAHRVLVSADITGAWLPRFERWVAPIR